MNKDILLAVERRHHPYPEQNIYSVKSYYPN